MGIALHKARGTFGATAHRIAKSSNGDGLSDALDIAKARYGELKQRMVNINSGRESAKALARRDLLRDLSEL